MGRLSKGLEFLITQVGNPKEKTDTVSDLIPGPSTQGDRIIDVAGSKVEVKKISLRKRQS